MLVLLIDSGHGSNGLSPDVNGARYELRMSQIHISYQTPLPVSNLNEIKKHDQTMYTVIKTRGHFDDSGFGNPIIT